MTITYYTRDNAGLITGPRKSHGWDSVEDFLSDICRSGEAPETETLTGWPHAEVVWYGDTGIAR